MTRWIILAATLVPGAAGAQETLQGWPGLAVADLSTVYVLDGTGTETAGRFLRLNPESIDLLVDGVEHRFEAIRVRRIQRRGDSLRNGALVGAVVGLGMGLVAGAISDCPGDDPGGSCPGVRAALVLVSAGVYAAIGTAVDALIVGRTMLYDAAQGPVALSASSTRRRRAAVGLRFRW